MSRSQELQPLPKSSFTSSLFEPPSSESRATSLDLSGPSEISRGAYANLGRHILPSISLTDEIPRSHEADPSTPLSSIVTQMRKRTSNNQTLHNTSSSTDDTSQVYLRSVSPDSGLQYNATDTSPNHPLSPPSSFSTAFLHTASEPHQSCSKSSLSSKQTQRGVAQKRYTSMHGLQDKYSSYPKFKSGVKIVHNKEEEAIPTSGLLWYRGPVYGALPGRTLRSHTTTTIRNKAWVIGGYDDKQSYRDIYCLDFETLQWSHPEYKGDIPPPCRGHTATAVGRRIFVIGGMSTHATSEPITVYIFDTLTLSWARPSIAPGNSPVQRRAHSAVYWDEKIWIFGGGNGFTALNDVWSLDVSPLIDNRRTIVHRTEKLALRWERIENQVMQPDTMCGNWPEARGYHSADVVDNFMFIIGGADGQSVLDSIWVLNLKIKVWYHIDWLKGSSMTSRLAHSSTRLGPYLFILGGIGKEYNSELHLLNLGGLYSSLMAVEKFISSPSVTLQEERRQVYGTPPMPRGYHTTVHGNGRIHVIGGANATYGFDDVWILELASLAYFPQITNFKVEALENIGWY